MNIVVIFLAISLLGVVIGNKGKTHNIILVTKL